jgi:hypothetical protein
VACRGAAGGAGRCSGWVSSKKSREVQRVGRQHEEQGGAGWVGSTRAGRCRGGGSMRNEKGVAGGGVQQGA